MAKNWRTQWKTIGLIAAATFALSACAPSEENPSSTQSDAVSSATEAQEEILAAHGLTGLDVEEIIAELDTMAVADRPDTLLASVQPTALVLQDQQHGEAELPMPEDRFYLSLAPYVNQTHDCYFHSLTTCLGELSGEQVDVTVTDQQSGEVVLEETRTTFDNGFTGIWLPRDLQGTIEVSHAGRTASALISTVHDDDLTCLTTLELT